MAQQLSDRRDFQFVLFEQLKIDELTQSELYGDLNKKTFDMVLAEARSLAVKEILPTAVISDREGCAFQNGTVTLPEAIHRVYDLIREGDWIALSDDLEAGGQGMPLTLWSAAMELFHGANTAVASYPMLGHGAGKLIEVFGTAKQKELFLEKIYSGEWGGTMALTEPSAGSDVGALATRAVKNGDGSYHIAGNKIFISAAEQDLTENIIHPVLARVEGAPAGSEGISLFIVPKIWVHEDGTLGEPNDVVCTGLEEKIGLHGGPTCSLTFGGKGQCRGWLLGEENKGLKAMFHMMNEERLSVAIQALGMASAANMYALNYARERKQGRYLTRMADSSAPQVAIVQHPDIRRILLWMKAQIEGLRSLNYYTSLCIDKVKVARDDEEKQRLEERIAMLTPICKAYTTERACEICLQAIQVYGGYGVCKDYPVEQLFRDVKISTIYEGTTGIQSMDLLGRKIGMKKGRVFMDLMADIGRTASKAKAFSGLEDLGENVEGALAKFGNAAMHLGTAAASKKVLAAFAHATPFMDIAGDIMVAWMLLWRAVTAQPKLEKIIGDADDEKKKAKIEKNKDAAFYSGQIMTARYFINSLLPVSLGRMDAVIALESAPVDITDAAFGG